MLKTHMSPLARKRLVKGESLSRSKTSEPEIAGKKRGENLSGTKGKEGVKYFSSPDSARETLSTHEKAQTKQPSVFLREKKKLLVEKQKSLL